MYNNLKLKKLAENCHALYLPPTLVYGFSYETCIFIYISDEDMVYIDRQALEYSCTTNKHLYTLINTYSAYTVHSKRELLSLIKEEKIKYIDLTKQ